MGWRAIWGGGGSQEPSCDPHSQEAGGQQQPLASRLVGEDVLQEVVDVAHCDPCGRATNAEATLHSSEAPRAPCPIPCMADRPSVGPGLAQKWAEPGRRSALRTSGELEL